MLLTTILNRLQHHKGFVYASATLVEAESGPTVEVTIRPRRDSKPICSCCGQRVPAYDRLDARRFEFPPFWGMKTCFVYTMRRGNCPRCGVRVEQVPWAKGKSPQTVTHQWFLARWAKRLSWKETAEAFQTTWHSVYSSVQKAVAFGLAQRELSGIEAIGVDEIHWGQGQYLTLVYQIDTSNKRLLWIGEGRDAEALRGFFTMLGKRKSRSLKFACSDMWKAYLGVLAEEGSAALHVLDRFHIMARLNKAIDQVRAAEARRLVADGYEPVLKHSRWCLLKRPSNLTSKQTVKLAEVLSYNLKTARSHLLREEFQRFWEYKSAYWAGRYLREWCVRVMRSRIEPMKKVARSLRKHSELILNWFRAKGTISAGVVEGLNNKAKRTMRIAYGFGMFSAIENALYHVLGDLPEPEFTHRFS